MYHFSCICLNSASEMQRREPVALCDQIFRAEFVAVFGSQIDNSFHQRFQFAHVAGIRLSEQDEARFRCKARCGPPQFAGAEFQEQGA